MSRSILVYLDHILEECSFLLEESQGLSFDKFLNDKKMTRAFLRSIGIIGEATKDLPDDFREEHTQIKWRKWPG